MLRALLVTVFLCVVSTHVSAWRPYRSGLIRLIDVSSITLTGVGAVKMTEDVIIEKLNDAIKRRLMHHNVRLGPGADNDIETFVAKAAKALIQDTSRIPEAEQAFERLIDEMVVSSKQLPGYPSDTIGEQTLRMALGRLCPLFPIC